MLSLCLNTSSTKGSLAVTKGHTVLQFVEWEKNQTTQQSHSELVTPLLQKHFFGIYDPKDLKLLMCGHGPGSFTGIRVTLAVIKSLSYINNLPIVSTDDCFNTALNSINSSLGIPIVIMIDAQKNSVFFAVYREQHGHIETLTSPQLLPLTELENQLKEKQYLCLGDGFLHYQPYLSENIKNKLRRDPNISDYPSAQIMSETILKNLSHYEQKNWKELLPLYLRASAAEETLLAKKK